MTLIMGGHYWKGQKLRDEQEVLAAARETLEIQLGIPKELETLVHKVTVQRDCIPQYKVGHQEWVGRVQKQVKEVYGGRLMMAGGAYNGLGIGTVGVSDCIRGAREVVSTLMGPV